MSSSNEECAFNKSIGSILLTFRLIAGLSQKQVGNHLGVTFQQVQKYEKGQNAITPFKLKKLCDLFRVAIPEMFPPSDAELDALIGKFSKRTAFEVLSCYSRLNDDTKKAVMGLLKCL